MTRLYLLTNDAQRYFARHGYVQAPRCAGNDCYVASAGTKIALQVQVCIMSTHHMILYVDSQFASPYAMSAYVALRVKGIAFKTECLELAASQNTAPSYLATSLTARVPTLVNGSFSLSESSAISEYLEELQPSPHLYPSTPEDRARARQVQAWLRSDLLALREDRSTVVVFYRPTQAPLSVAGQAAAEKLIRVATTLLAHEGPNLFDEWCIADADLALMLNRLVLNGDAVPEPLVRYAQHQWQHPAVRKWVQLARPPL